MTKDAEQIALRRMEHAGAVTTINTVLTQLAENWTTPAGQAVLPIARSLIPAQPRIGDRNTMTEFNDRVIADYRANNGRVGAWGSNLVLIHHRGARTGTERVNPAMSRRDSDGWLVVGSAAGSPRDPAWVVNLRAHPDVEIEAVVDGTVETIPVRAVELTGAERETAFAALVAMAPAFGTYQTQAQRQLPVIRFTRRRATS